MRTAIVKLGQFPVFSHLISCYKSALKRAVIWTHSIVNLLPLGRIASSQALDAIWKRKFVIEIESHKIQLHVPNWLTYYRAKSFFQKEPETLSWIDSMPKGSVMWDIGANVGIYSVYAGKKNLEVVAIEPSSLNLDLLNRNIISNDLSELVTIIPFGVGRETGIFDFYMSPLHYTWGGAHNSLAENVGFDGKEIVNPVKTKTLCYSLDELVKINNLPSPTHLKIDVDGLELEVLLGGGKILEETESILIEIDKDFEKQRIGVKQLLEKSSFYLAYQTSDSLGTSNQIWSKLSRPSK